MKLLFLSALSLFLSQHIIAQSWTPQGEGLLPVGYAIMSISVVDDTVIWVNASQASALSGQPVPGIHLIKVLRSVDGGETWTSPDAVNVAESIGRISFELEAIDVNTAWLTTQDYSSGRGRVLYKTIDGGMTWTPKLTHRAAGVFVDVLDDAHIYCQNTTVQAWSGDGGETWNLDTIAGFDSEEFTVLASGNNMTAAIGDTVWVGTTLGNVIRITDNGATNELIDVGMEVSIQCISFIDHRRGMLFYTIPETTENGLMRTYDGGTTWDATPSKPQTPYEYNLSYVPGTDHAYVAVSNLYSDKAEYYWTTNFGESWLSGDIDNANTNAIAFANAQAGWVSTGTITRADQPIVYKWSGDVLSGVRDELKPISELSIYPNPASGVLQYDFSEYASTPHRFSICDMKGRVLVSGQSTSNTIQINQLPSGMYVFNIETDTHHGRIKFVKNAQ